MPLESTQFARESREDVTRSHLNLSTSKQLWSFGKKKRFQPVKAECPIGFYQQQVSTISKRRVSFSQSKRKVFT
jgi:hypothetical protein